MLFLGEVAKLRKVAINIIMSVCLSVLPSGWNISASTGQVFKKFDIQLLFRKLVEKIHVSIISDKNNRYFTRISTYIYDNISSNSN